MYKYIMESIVYTIFIGFIKLENDFCLVSGAGNDLVLSLWWGSRFINIVL